MADNGMGLVYVGLFFFLGCLNQISENALLHEVQVVPSQGQAAGSQHPSYPPHSSHYPPPHPAYPGAYPQAQEAHHPYDIPNQQGPADPQYPAQNSQGAFNHNAYPQHATDPQNFHPPAAGHLTPGQTAPTQGASYPDHFGAPSHGAYPQQGTPPYTDPTDPTQAQLHAQSHAHPIAHRQTQGQGQVPAQSQLQSQTQSQAQPQAQPQTQPQSAYPGPAPAAYPQGQSQPTHAGQHQGPVYPYQHGSHQYPGAFPNQVYPGQIPPGYPNTPQASPYQDSNAQRAGAPSVSPQSGAAPTENSPTYPEQGSAAAAHAAAAAAAQSSNSPAASDIQQAKLPVPSQQSPQAAVGVGASSGAAVPYPGAPAADAASQPQSLAGTQTAEYPTGNTIPTQPGGAMAPYKYQDKKPTFPAAVEAADTQPKTVAGGQPGFPPPRGQSAGLPSAGLSYPNHPVSAAANAAAAAAAASHHVLPSTYPGHMPQGAGTVPHAYPRGYPYPYHGSPIGSHMPHYHGPIHHGHPPYPGQPRLPFLDPHGRPSWGPPTSKHGPPPYPKKDRFPNNNVTPQVTATTTTLPETTQGATLFPPELRCFAQSECELGCCFASDGSILWDHLNNYGKEGYCYTKTKTIPGDGCYPGKCVCQSGQSCISVPPENVTMPRMMGEVAEGTILGNPKCYTEEQELQIINWLNKLGAIIAFCRLDSYCPGPHVIHK